MRLSVLAGVFGDRNVSVSATSCYVESFSDFFLVCSLVVEVWFAFCFLLLLLLLSLMIDKVVF